MMAITLNKTHTQSWLCLWWQSPWTKHTHTHTKLTLLMMAITLNKAHTHKADFAYDGNHPEQNTHTHKADFAYDGNHPEQNTHTHTKLTLFMMAITLNHTKLTKSQQFCHKAAFPSFWCTVKFIMRDHPSLKKKKKKKEVFFKPSSLFLNLPHHIPK